MCVCFFIFFHLSEMARKGWFFLLTESSRVEPKMGWRIIIVIIFFFYRIIINISVNHDSLG